LKQKRAQFFFQNQRPFQKNFPWLFAIDQFFNMGNKSRNLPNEDKCNLKFLCKFLT
jgi:hypothetical protein